MQRIPGAELRQRARLEQVLDRAMRRRLTVVSAPPGFGKTSLLSRWSQGVNPAWLTVTSGDADAATLAARLNEALRLRVPGLPRRLGAGEGAASGPTGRDDAAVRAEVLASLLGQALAEHLRRGLVLVLDDVHLLPPGGSAVRLLETFVRQAPPLLHVVVAGQTQVPFATTRLRERGELEEIDGVQLALTDDEIADWLEGELGQSARRLAPRLHEVTAGWPVATRMAIADLKAADPATWTARLELQPSEALFDDLAARVLALEPPHVRALLRALAVLDWCTPALATALGVPDAEESIASLRRRGLFLEAVPSEPDGIALIALARAHLLAHDPLPEEEVARIHDVAVAHWHGLGRGDRVLEELLRRGDTAELARVLGESGERLATTGRAALVLRAIDAVPKDEQDAALERLTGMAAQLAGDWARAEAAFASAGSGMQQLDAGLAWRLGLIHHLRGDLDEALAVYARGVADEPSRDRALLRAWTATVHWLRGEAELCGRLAADALADATEVDDPQALAAAHTVLAMLAALEGDRRANDAHYLRALDFAEAANDVLQVVRIRTNRSSHHLEEGAFDEALAELEIAISLAEATGYGPFAAVALANRAEIRLRLGQLELAGQDLRAAVEVWDRMGSRMVSYPLNVLGDLALVRGDREAAVAHHRKALEVTEGHGDLQGYVPALVGLAWALIEVDPLQAATYAAKAVEIGESLALVEALVAAGHAALAMGEPSAAAEHAARAVELADVRRDRLGLASALELQAALSSADEARALLERAVALWRDVGDPVGLARASLALARHWEPDDAREVALSVLARMRELGCRPLAVEADALLASLDEQEAPRVAIVTLGGFRVELAGEPVAPNAWQSRKARDLLKILISRRGRPVPRDTLVELLWPGEDPARTANRLNVALATVRGVLDPERVAATDTYVATEQDAVRLVLDAVEVDVERFLVDAAAGARLLRGGRTAAAIDRLRRAEATYTGAFLEEDVHEDWPAGLREQARATYVEVARQLAGHAVAQHDTDGAVRYLLRVVEQDRYDEATHLELVQTLSAAGRHGEARHRYRLYQRAMEDLDVEPAPFPSSGT